jgi:DNA-binding transcriptional regulator YiaG
VYVFDKLAVRTLRKRQGMTRDVLAHRTGVAYDTVVGWEQGRSVPSGRNFSKLVAVLDCVPADLFTLKDDPSRGKVDAG